MDKLSVDELVEHGRRLAFAVESASPDFLGQDDGRCVTCYHRNPDGPALFGIIEAQASQLLTMKDALGEAFSTLIYIFECSDDAQTSKAAKEAADKIDAALISVQPVGGMANEQH